MFEGNISLLNIFENKTDYLEYYIIPFCDHNVFISNYIYTVRRENMIAKWKNSVFNISILLLRIYNHGIFVVKIFNTIGNMLYFSTWNHIIVYTIITFLYGNMIMIIIETYFFTDIFVSNIKMFEINFLQTY